MEPTNPSSPRLERFAKEAAAYPDGAVEAFQTELREAAGPLVEPFGDDGQQVLVTFVYVGPAAESVTLYSPAALLAGRDPEFPRLVRIDGTQVWHHSVVLAPDVTSVYSFVVDDPFATVEDLDALATEDPSAFLALAYEHFGARRVDPYNPATLYPAQAAFAGVEEVEPQMRDSVLMLPRTRRTPWTVPVDAHPRGAVEEHTVTSAILGNERRVWVYTPPGYRPDGDTYPVAVLLDGLTWRTVASTATMLDQLIVTGQIPPIVSVWVDNVARMTELSCQDSFCDFLADELLPWVRDRLLVSTEAAAVLVGGVSRGGLASAYAGLRRPDAIGNVLSMSGAYWWTPDDGDSEPEWLAGQIAATDRKPVRWYIDVGSLEWTRLEGMPLSSMLGSNRHLRDVLTARGYDLTYQEFPGGHDFASWGRTVADGLVSLFGPGVDRPETRR